MMDPALALKLRLFWPEIKARWIALRRHPEVPPDVLVAGDAFQAAVDRWISTKDTPHAS